MSEQIERVSRALAGLYPVERELGSGGMAYVYLARDLKHDRLVAVKVFRPELAASLGTERFLREIQIAAGLSHPHILPLYDSGEANGFLYYVMPLVEGESLADRIGRELQLPFYDALQITREVADALTYAHSRGLVHRDIKPDNIMLAGGHAVVMDFGIARAVSAAGGEKLTQTGMAVGTPGYMSPEQAGGGDVVDGRSDIYSLGCVLYEMLVGQMPFTGPTPLAIMARHSMEAVPSPHIIRDTIPDVLEDAILCALAKSPADRFRTAAEFADALSLVDIETATHRRASRVNAPKRRRRGPMFRPATVALSTAAVLGLGWIGWQIWPEPPPPEDGPSPSRIAVRYFEDRTPGGEFGHVADGLTEELINQLAQVRGLDVISRNGMAPYRDETVSRDSIVRALEAGTLIEGNVEAVGDRLRVTAVFVEAASGAEFDRASVELPANQLLAAQDSIATHVSRILREQLGVEIQLRERRAAAANVEAWVLVQRGERARKEAGTLLQHGDLAEAVPTYQLADSLLGRAEVADPEWPEPIVLRARLAFERSLSATEHHDLDAFTLAGLEHTTRALELDEDNPDALEVRGAVQYNRWLNGLETDHAAAERLLDGVEADLVKATTINSQQAYAWFLLGHYYYNRKDDTVESNIAARNAYEADAYLAATSNVIELLYTTSYDLEAHPQANRWCDVGSQRFPSDPRFVRCQLWLMTSRARDPDVTTAWRLAGDVVELTGEHGQVFALLDAQIAVAAVSARAGLADSARHVLDRSLGDAEIDPQRYLIMRQAFVRALLGDNDDALRLLGEYLVANPDRRTSFERHGHWWWRNLRDDPRFQRMVGGAE